jgi:hypothetical protein
MLKAENILKKKGLNTRFLPSKVENILKKGQLPEIV